MEPISQQDAFIFRLFIAGDQSRSRSAIEGMRWICARLRHGSYKLEIIDVYKRPDLAERDAIVETPTLIKELPLPKRRVVGDLTDRSLLHRVLGLGSIDRKSQLELGEHLKP